MYKVSALLLFIMIFFPYVVSAKEYSLEWGQGTAIGEKEKALDALFLYAVVESASNILGIAFEGRQYQSMFYFFKDSFLEYVEAYAEVGPLDSVMPLTRYKEILSVDIFINEKKIKKELQDIGAFYTRNSPLHYELVGEAPVSGEDLLLLEGIFGLVRVPSSPIKLFFWKEQGSKYSGILSWDTWQYSYNNLALRTLWVDLWSEYWKKEKSAKIQSITYEIEVFGLESQNDISSLTQSFEKYASSIYDVKLEKLGLVEDGYVVKWFFTIEDEVSFVSIVRKILSEYSTISYKVTKQ
ncbi:MAG: hypothetical protein ACRCV3_03440 [Desulfovibrionaceae bacterium]